MSRQARYMSAQPGRSRITPSTYSRHATEASVIAEHKLEELRTKTVVGGSAVVDGTGAVNSNGLFTLTWDATAVTEGTLITVSVVWEETEDSPHTVTLRTIR